MTTHGCISNPCPLCHPATYYQNAGEQQRQIQVQELAGQISLLTVKLHAAEEREALLSKALKVGRGKRSADPELLLLAAAALRMSNTKLAERLVEKFDAEDKALSASPSGRLAKLEAVVEAAKNAIAKNQLFVGCTTLEAALSNLAGEG